MYTGIKYQYGFRHRIFNLFLVLLSAYILSACSYEDYYYMTEDEKLKVISGERRVYESNQGNIDTIQFYLRNYFQEDFHSPTYLYYETQNFIGYFYTNSGLKSSTFLGDNHFPLIADQEPEFVCVAIQGCQSSEFIWHGLQSTNIYSDERFDEFDILDTTYTNVYIVRPIPIDSVVPDSIKVVRKVFYSPNDGLFKYFYTDGETFTLTEIIFPNAE